MKLVSVLAISLFAASAFASKARVAALQYADHLVDVQTSFKNPAYVNKLNPLLTFEFGAAGGGAEGGLINQTAGGSKMLLYMGHQNTTAIAAGGDVRTANSYLAQNNPVEFLYGSGDMAYGASLSTVNNDASGTKETTLIAKWGMSTADTHAYAHVGLVSTAEDTTSKNKMTAAPSFLVGGAKDSGDYRYFGSIMMGNYKNEVATVESDIKDMDVKLGLEDRSMKKADADVYYGALFNMSTRETAKKNTVMLLPIFVGIETPVASWLTFRGSVSQNFLLGSTKDENTSTKADGIGNNTTASAGLGFKHGNLTLDGVLTAGTSGDINGNQFLSQASVTYNF